MTIWQRPPQQFVIVISLLVLAMLSACGGTEPPAPATGGETPATEAPAPTSEPTEPPSDGSADPAPTGQATLRLVPASEAPQVEIWVDDVSDFYALELAISYDPAQVEIVDADADTDGLQIQAGEVPAPDFVAANLVDVDQQVINYAVTQIAPREGFNGSGLIATIDLADLPADLSAISILTATLVSEEGQAIPVIISE